MTSTALMYAIQKSIKSTKKDNSVCPILMITGKKYTPRKLVVGQSAARKIGTK